MSRLDEIKALWPHLTEDELWLVAQVDFLQRHYDNCPYSEGMEWWCMHAPEHDGDCWDGNRPAGGAIDLADAYQWGIDHPGRPIGWTPAAAVSPKAETAE